MRMLLALLALFAATAAAPARDWTRTVTRTADGGFVLGNPGASVKLVEYISYTCPHCAALSAQARPVLVERMVRSGSTSVELRNAVRDELDMMATVAARCGSPDGFFRRSEAILAAQDRWTAQAREFGAASRARLQTLDANGIFKAYADGSGVSALVLAHGVTRKALDACFADAAERTRLADASQAIFARIEGTPAFEINGAPQAGVFSWPALQPNLRAAGAR